jgi:hypothetical protein
MGGDGPSDQKHLVTVQAGAYANRNAPAASATLLIKLAREL